MWVVIPSYKPQQIERWMWQRHRRKSRRKTTTTAAKNFSPPTHKRKDPSEGWFPSQMEWMSRISPLNSRNPSAVDTYRLKLVSSLYKNQTLCWWHYNNLIEILTYSLKKTCKTCAKTGKHSFFSPFYQKMICQNNGPLLTLQSWQEPAITVSSSSLSSDLGGGELIRTLRSEICQK